MTIFPWKISHMDYCRQKEREICECLKDTFDRLCVELHDAKRRLEERTNELSELKRKIALKKNVP